MSRPGYSITVAHRRAGRPKLRDRRAGTLARVARYAAIDIREPPALTTVRRT
jgi:hypothetical protein